MLHSIGQSDSAVGNQANRASQNNASDVVDPGTNPGTIPGARLLLTGPVSSVVAGTDTPFNGNIPRDVSNIAQPIGNAVSSLTSLDRSVTVPIDQLYATLANAMDGDVSLSLTYHWGDGRGDRVVEVNLTRGERGEVQVTRQGGNESYLLEPHNIWGIKLPGYTSGTFASASSTPHSVSIRTASTLGHTVSHPAASTTSAPASRRKAGPDNPRAQLEELAKHTRERYLMHLSRGIGDAPLAEAAKREHARINHLLQWLPEGRNWPPGLTVARALAYCEFLERPSLDLIGELDAGGVNPNKANEIVAAFAKSNLTLTRHTLPTAILSPGSKLDELGSGAMNKVYRGSFIRLTDNGSFDGALRVLGDENIPQDAITAGISKDKPQYQLRARACWQIDQLGSYHCTTETHNVLYNGQICSVSAMAPGNSSVKSGDFVIPLPDEVAKRLHDPVTGPEHLRKIAATRNWLGYKLDGNQLHVVSTKEVMIGRGDDQEKSTISKETNVLHDYDNAVTRRELTTLQWFDGRTGGTDRGTSNFFIGKDGKVRAIDNDLSFGKNLKDPNHIHGATFTPFTPEIEGKGGTKYRVKIGFKGACLPEVIDRKLAESILSPKPEDMAKVMAGLSDEEIEWEQARLEIQRAAIRAMPPENILDTDEQWLSPRVTALLGLDTVRRETDEIAEILKDPKKNYSHVEGRMMEIFDAATKTSYIAREALLAKMSLFKKEPVIEASILNGTATVPEFLAALGLADPPPIE